jgi:folate-binding protein YgfZ
MPMLPFMQRKSDSLNAERVDWLGEAVPLSFGDANAEYLALTAGVGLVDLSARTRIELTGRDRASFLHNMCTNEIRKLPVGAGREIFLTDARGHVLGHGFVYELEESLVFDTVPGQAPRLMTHLDRYIIREQVELHDRTSEWFEFLVAGPRAVEILTELTGEPPPQELLTHGVAQLAGKPVTVYRIGLVHAPSFAVVGSTEDAAPIWEAIERGGAWPCGFTALDTLRIEQGIPYFGLDITEKNLPQEVGRDASAISFTKGCYIGQETVARLDALGHVNKQLVGVRLEGPQVPKPGLELNADEQVVGQVTSAAFSRQLGAPLALAYVRRGNNAPGSKLASPLGNGEVVALPV